MIKTEQLTHQQQTLALWESVAREEEARRQKREQSRQAESLLRHVTCHLDVIWPDREERLDVTVHDVGTTGACLYSMTSLPLGQVVRLHPPNGSHPDDVILGHVTACRERMHFFRIGIQFGDESPTFVFDSDPPIETT